jgi:hypothetical protein
MRHCRIFLALFIRKGGVVLKLWNRILLPLHPNLVKNIYGVELSITNDSLDFKGDMFY